jgi:hypothetical protein
MPETKTVTFSHTELAKLLIKQAEIHEGLWAIYTEFGLAASLFGAEGTEDINPTAIIALKKIGIHRFDEPNALTVDAAKVNPALTPKQKSK